MEENDCFVEGDSKRETLFLLSLIGLLIMEEMDDFGDIYGDFEVPVNNESGGKEAFCLNSDRREADSSSEDLVLDNPVEQINSIVDKVREEADGKSVFSDSKAAVMAEDENQDIEKDSDSEDDLHILLNEEDCRSFPIGRCVNVGQEVSDEKHDDLVIVTEGHHPSKDRKRVDSIHFRIDSIESGPVSSGAERGNAIKGGHISQYSQFKYVRPYSAASPSNAKAGVSSGFVSFSSLACGRGDWDLNGSAPQMISCSEVISSSCNSGILTVLQNGFDFSLPRNRSILDMDIEMFEQKYWRHPGVDITDFFNFGLDEESWKLYCKCLAHYRQQATMQTKIPVYESSRDSQFHEVEFLPKEVASGAACSEITQSEQQERISSLVENVNRGMRCIEPKGRAIQVEGGIGERRPSMGVRHPRRRDSDVIQIEAHGPNGDSSVSGEEEPEDANDSLSNIYGKGGAEADNSQCMQYYGTSNEDRVSYEHSQSEAHSSEKTRASSPPRYAQKSASNSLPLDHDYQDAQTTYHHEHDHQNGNKPVLSEVTEVQETIQDLADKNDSPNDDTSVFPAESASSELTHHNFSPSCLERHSRLSKVEIAVDKKNSCNHGKTASSRHFSGLQESVWSKCHQANAFRTNISKTEAENSKDSSKDRGLVQEDKKCYSRTKLHSVAELKTSEDDDKASLWADNKGQYHRDRLASRHRTWRRERLHDCDFDRGEDSSYREREMFIRCHDKRFTEHGQVRSAFAKHIDRKVNTRYSEETETYLTRNWDEREYRHGQRIAARDNEVWEKEWHIWERNKNGQKIRDITHNESTQTISKNCSCYMGKKRFRFPSVEYLRKEAENDNIVVEQRYIEEPWREKYERQLRYHGREEDSIQDKGRRRLVYIGRETEGLDQRERNDQSPHFDSDISWRSIENDGKYWVHPFRRSLFLQSNRELNIMNGREWYDACPPRNTLSWRSDKRYADDWRPPNFRDIHPKKHNNGGFVSSIKEHHGSSHAKYIDFNDDEDDFEEGATYPNDIVFYEKRRCSWQSNPTQWTDDELSFSHQERDGLYEVEESIPFKRHFRHELSRGNHDSLHTGNLDRRGIIVQESTASGFSKRISSVPDVIGGGRREAEASRCRESVDLYLDGCDGKYPGRSSTAGDTRRSGHGDIDCSNDRALAALKHYDEGYISKEVPLGMSKLVCGSITSKADGLHQYNPEQSPDSNEKWRDKCPIVQHQKVTFLEEGQLLVDEPVDNGVCATGKRQALNQTTQGLAVDVSKGDSIEKQNSQSENAADGGKLVAGYDNNRLLETLAKMERRKERFKEPISLKREPDKNLKPQSDLMVIENAEVKRQRPARKRRWGGS